jgi:hypothetical protein
VARARELRAALPLDSSGPGDGGRLAAYRARFESGTEERWRGGQVTDADLEAPTHDAFAVLMQAFALSFRASDDARATSARLRAQLEAHGLLAEAALVGLSEAVTDGDGELVESRARDAFALAPADPWISRAVVRAICERLGERLAPALAEAVLDEVVRGHFAGYVAESARIDLAVALAMRAAEGARSPPKRCVQAFALMGKEPLWEEPALAARLECFRTHAPELAAGARADLERFRADSSRPLKELMQGVR